MNHELPHPGFELWLLIPFPRIITAMLIVPLVCVCVCIYIYIYIYIKYIHTVSLSSSLSLSIYIYIYCHPQTDCFILSELFSVARHVGRLKLGFKPIQLYVRLSLRPLGQQAYHIWLREFLRYLCSNSSSHLFTFLYPIGYLSAQFFRRALHYASGGWKFLHQSAQPPWGSIERERVCVYVCVCIYIYI